MSTEKRRKAKPTLAEKRMLMITAKDAELNGDQTAALALGTLLLTDAIEAATKTKTNEVDLNVLR